MLIFSDSDCFQKLNLDLKAETEISPTLREILAMFDDTIDQDHDKFFK